ncbi:MAG: TAXI family TRAP transporter solute-binding subunit [Hyphomicrobiaceae bacterium]
MSDLASVLDEGETLRVLSVAGRGGLSDIADLLFLQGMSLAIIPANTFDYAVSNNLYPRARSRLRYISRLYTQAVHLVAGTDIKSIADLHDRDINLVSPHHQAFVTARTLFEAIGLRFRPVFIDQRLALEKVKRGKLDATLILSGRPSPLLAELESADRLRLIEIPFETDVPSVYYPTSLTSADYPRLIPSGRTVATVGTAAILMVFNFKPGNERYGKVARFVDSFLSRLDDLQRAPRHPRWRDMNLTAKVSGMQRFPLVKEWIDRHRPQAVARSRTPKRSLRQTFQAFIETQAAAGRTTELLRSSKAELYQRFIAWRRGDRSNPNQKPPALRLSLKDLFRQFIADEVARIGKSNVLALGKPELYRRFIEWRRQGQLSSYAPVPKPKPISRSERSLKELFRQFIALEVGRIGKSNVLALPKPALYQRFVEWRRKGRVVSFASLRQTKAKAKANAKAKPSLKELFRRFISAEVARIGRTNVLALSKPELYRRFLRWRRRGTEHVAGAKKKQSLKVLFRQFIDAEVARVGKDKVMALSKSELYSRFLRWRKRGQASATAAATARKIVAKPKRRLRSLFKEFIEEEISRIGKDRVLAASKPQLFQRFLDWRRQRVR